MTTSSSIIYCPTLKYYENAINDEGDLWRSNDYLSSIERSFSSESIRSAVHSLVWSRFGSEIDKKSRRSRRCKNSSSRYTSDGSSYSFDDKEFLITALGDQFNSELSYMLQETSEDFSVTTSNLSALISNCPASGSTDFICSEIGTTSNEDTLDLLHTRSTDNTTPALLHEELAITSHNKNQILKALYFDDKLTKGGYSTQRLEAEKFLLIYELKLKLLRNQINQPAPNQNNRVNTQGLVRFSQLHFCPKNQEFFDQKFLCVVTHQSQIYASEFAGAKISGLICFKETFCLSGLPDNFTIKIQLYSICPRQITPRPSKLFVCQHWHKENIINDDIPVRSSLFNLWDEAELTIEDIKQSQFDKPSNLQLKNGGKIIAHITSQAEINICMSGLMDVHNNISIAWNTYWCNLTGKILNCYSYPQDEIFGKLPKFFIDLSSCTVIRRLTRQECARKRSILIKTNRSQEFSFSISSDSAFRQWEQCFKAVMATIKVWE